MIQHCFLKFTVIITAGVCGMTALGLLYAVYRCWRRTINRKRSAHFLTKDIKVESARKKPIETAQKRDTWSFESIELYNVKTD